MEMHQEIRRARKALDLSQAQLAHFVGVQRRQISTLERGGNVTLNTLKRVLAFLPNLHEFTFEQIRMKPQYRDSPPFEWALFYAEMRNLQLYLEDLTKVVKAWVDIPAPKDEDPEKVHERTEAMAREMRDILQRGPGGGEGTGNTG
jgi:transcriptional regulator with XRE-family HTH domain